MTSINQTINNAISLSADLGKIVTREYIQERFYPHTNPKSQYENLRILTYKKLNNTQQKMLREMLPDTHPDAWLYDDRVEYYRARFIERFHVHALKDDGSTLTELWDGIESRKLNVHLIKRYL